MPFLTEELWHQLPQSPVAKSIALAAFPEARPEWRNPRAVEKFSLLQQVIGEFRDIRAQMKLDPKKKVLADFSASDLDLGNLVQENFGAIKRLAALSEITFLARKNFDSKSGAVRSTAQFDVRIGYAGAVDVGAELTRVRKEIDRLTKDISSKQRQLADETFRSRAPEKIIAGIQSTLTERQLELMKLTTLLQQLESSS
jgi:valyl-tRNA synthetase